MSTTIKSILAFGLFTLATACAQQEEVVVIDPAPIMSEPASTKY